MASLTGHPSHLSQPETSSGSQTDLWKTLMVSYLPSKNFSPYRVNLRLRDKTKITTNTKKDQASALLCRESMFILDLLGSKPKNPEEELSIFTVLRRVVPTKETDFASFQTPVDLHFKISPVTDSGEAAASESETLSPCQSSFKIELEAKLRHDPEGVPQKTAHLMAEKDDVASQVVQAFQPPFVWTYNEDFIITKTAKDTEPKTEPSIVQPAFEFLQMTIDMAIQIRSGGTPGHHELAPQMLINPEQLGMPGTTTLDSPMIKLTARLHSLVSRYLEVKDDLPVALEQLPVLIKEIAAKAQNMVQPFMELVAALVTRAQFEKPPGFVETLDHLKEQYEILKSLAITTGTDLFDPTKVSTIKLVMWETNMYWILMLCPLDVLATLKTIASKYKFIYGESCKMTLQNPVDPQVQLVMANMLTFETFSELTEKEASKKPEPIIKKKLVCNFSAYHLFESLRFDEDDGGQSFVLQDAIGLSVQYGESSNEESVPRYIRYFTSADMSEDTMKL